MKLRVRGNIGAADMRWEGKSELEKIII